MAGKPSRLSRFSEIHPDYYQIPVADRQALIEADERAHREAEEETENRSNNRRRPRHRNSRRRGNGERVQSEIVENASTDPSQAAQPFEHANGSRTPTTATGHDAGHHPADAEHHDHEHHDHEDHEHSHDHEHEHADGEHVHASENACR